MLTHFIVVEDVERSRRFYADVLGAEVVMEGEPSIVALANGWVIINVVGPTEDKLVVTLETRRAIRGRVLSFLNIRVADIEGSTPTGDRRLPDAAPAARRRDSLLCWRS